MGIRRRIAVARENRDTLARINALKWKILLDDATDLLPLGRILPPFDGKRFGPIREFAGGLLMLIGAFTLLLWVIR